MAKQLKFDVSARESLMKGVDKGSITMDGVAMLDGILAYPHARCGWQARHHGLCASHYDYQAQHEASAYGGSMHHGVDMLFSGRSKGDLASQDAPGHKALTLQK